MKGHGQGNSEPGRNAEALSPKATILSPPRLPCIALQPVALGRPPLGLTPAVPLRGKCAAPPSTDEDMKPAWVTEFPHSNPRLLDPDPVFFALNHGGP